ncbi:MAG: beta-galactosidase, partial [Verrucomicrobia bacterium]|nr:beta-galactosidase [Verrucomicrobiota bacterium]
MLTILAGFFSLTLVFGEEFLIEDFNSTPQKTWKFWNGNEFPGAEGHFEILSKNGTDKCGKLSFDFSKGGAYVSAECQLHDDRWKESDPLTGITFDLFKPEGVRVKIRLTDSSNQTFQKEIRAASDRWSKAYTSLDFWEDSWGGKNDRIFHGLPTRLSILADKLQIKRGEILFDNIRLSSGVQENEVQLEHSFRKIVPAQSWWCENGEWKPDIGELKLKFSQNKHSASLNFPARTLPGTPKKIILRGKGSVDGLKVTFHTHTHFMTFLKRDISPTAANDGFEFVTATPPGNDWNWAGGENDGKIHGPMRLGRIDFACTQANEIDLKDVDSILVTTAPNDCILMQYAETLSDNENIHFIWNGQVVSSKAIKGDLLCTLKSWNGETLQETKRSITIPGDLDKTSETFTFPVPQKLNFVEACFIFSAPGLNEDEIYSTWLGDFPRNTDFTKDMDSPFGMGVYLYRLPMDQMETVARKAAEAGVKWTREEFNWSILQPRRGDYNWVHFDHLVDVAEKYGIQVYGITAYWSGWTKPYTEEGIQEYLEYLKACVTRYKGRIHHWEIWNEPNIFFWQGPKEMYTDLLRRCYQMIKEIDPDIQVLGLS